MDHIQKTNSIEIIEDQTSGFKTVNVNCDNVNKVNLLQSLGDLRHSQPVFDGMPRLSFSSENLMGELIRKHQSQAWSLVGKSIFSKFAPRKPYFMMNKFEPKDNLGFYYSSVLSNER